MQKFIKDVFCDYTGNSSIIDSQLENVNLYKKTNKLQVNITASKRLNITEIEDFEQYLINKFKISKTIINILVIYDFTLSFCDSITAFISNIANDLVKHKQFSNITLLSIIYPPLNLIIQQEYLDVLRNVQLII